MRVCLSILIFFLTTFSLFADAVFLTDGKVLEGTIQKWTGNRIHMNTGEKIVIVSQNRVTRITRDNRYKKKIFIHRKNGPTLHAHIVEEQPGYVIVREDLQEPGEKRIERGDILSISSTPDDKDLAGRFTNHLGARLGLSMNGADMPSAVSPEMAWNLEPLFFQLYYYHRRFDIDFTWMPRVRRYWQNYKAQESEQASLDNDEKYRSVSDYSRLTTTIYFFRKLNLSMGATLGHVYHRADKLRSNNPSTVTVEYSSLRYQAVAAGITWKFLERFRVGWELYIPYRKEIEYKDTMVMAMFSDQTWIRLNMRHPLPGLALFFTAFIFENISLEVGHQFFVYDMKTKSVKGGAPVNPFGQKLRVFSHRVTFSMGYGFDLQR